MSINTAYNRVTRYPQTKKRQNYSQILKTKTWWKRLKKTKNKNKNFIPRSIAVDSGKVFINESLWRYCKFLWSKCKKLCTEEWIEAFWVSNHQINLRIEPEEAVLRISHIQDMEKLLPGYNSHLD